ncbi:MAG: MATE family efflux transporter [Lachnospiraceae bacterium]|uniref:MATE family efflux transporter n=1 Tax=Parablautia sp. Marseille-Q6255 TaxID=3039593 RepID=UPI0024BD5201|nr:MATE family efflux transporter [Parablautia sp. Marseille-Q6255]
MKKYIGNKAFYAMVLSIAVPIMVQNGITNFVAMLDNIMIGRVGTEQMSGVAVANQLLLILNISIFGMVSGAGIFGAQYFGSNNMKGVRDTFRFKIVSIIILMVVSIWLMYVKGGALITLYLHEDGITGSADATLGYGVQYLRIMLIGMLPYAATQIYASTLREMGETVAPMRAGIAAVVVNTSLNYVLIFGKFGAPCLGVAGAAIATVVSRFVECTMIIVWTHRRSERLVFIKGAYRTLRVPSDLVKKILIKGSPLMINEVLWSVGMAVLMQCYSMYGLVVIAGLNIASTISNVCNVIWLAMGNALAIIIGQLLGAGRMEEAKDTDRKLIFFSVASCFAIGTILVLLAPVFPRIYNTSPQVRSLAMKFIIIGACLMPVQAFLHSAYFTLRSGGRTVVTFCFDSGFIWVCSIPLAFVLSRYSGLPILATYIICQSVDIIKCVIGYVLVKKGVWLQNIVE